MGLLKSLIRAGTQNQDFENKNDIILLNQVSLGGGLICVVLSIVSIPLRAYDYMMVNTVTGLLCMGVILLNHWRFDTLARYLFSLVLPLAMVAYIFLFGNIGAENYLIVGAILAVYLLRKRTIGRNIVFTICCVGFLATKVILWQYHGSLEMSELSNFLFFPNTVFSLLLIYASAMMFRTVQEREREQLKKVSQTRAKLLSIMSHDLRSPINSLQMLSENYTNPHLSPEDKDKMMNEITERLNYTGHLVDNVLVWVKKQMDGIRANKVVVNMNETIRSNIQLADKDIRDKNISVIFTDYINPDVFTDHEMIDLVFRNVLSNAIKFSHPGGEILIEVSQIQTTHYISVQDSGTGMEREDLNKLFKEQRSKRGTSDEKGFGIGMLLVKEFTEILGETIEAQSELGEGTKITFTVKSSTR